MHPLAVNFIARQAHLCRNKPRGRRYTLDDKIFAVALFKQSGKAYRFLSKVFCLPSKRTLLRLLNKIKSRDCILDYSLKDSDFNLITAREDHHGSSETFEIP